ncbi:uncharacterized protein C10orf67 homolog, mitochondrial [Trichosurus vulpecula]|uniref:uncharacterized protein C10orf67 homolog, mitochondrial n=1 Tax=Trichosurus vulpecula TaxID=9337 RepID=UPI00186AE788|nr:uncharacterized protein C10orf67 homolog, mitochondrial [Trichosurus vulpecula]
MNREERLEGGEGEEARPALYGPRPREAQRAASESTELHRAQMDEPKSAENPRVETWGPPPTIERGKKYRIRPLEDQLEYYVLDPRLTLSDDLKVGYFKTDRATQTDVTEVLEIRQLSNTTQKLVKITDLLQRDFKYLKTYLEMQFEDRLREESMKLYKKLQMIIQEIVALHEKNENTMRKSFYKQLCDAIASIRGAYSQFFEVDDEIAKLSSANANLFRKKLREKNDLIRELQEQLVAYKEKELFKVESGTEESSEKVAHLEKEISDLRRENDKLTKFITSLEENLQLCEKANTLLEGELLAMKQKMEKDQKMIQKLTLMKDKLSEDLDQEKRAVEDMFEEQKEDMEETRRLLEAEDVPGVRSPKGIPRSYFEEKPSVRRTPSRNDLIWREGVDGKQALEFQVKKLKKILEMQNKQLKWLQTEADQESKMWERKCLILRNSLHALKDEMFTRQSFVRQFVSLSDTSFNYYKAKPLYIQPKQSMVGQEKSFQSTVLPHLDSSSHSQISDDFFLLSMPTTSRGKNFYVPSKDFSFGRYYAVSMQLGRAVDRA